jgi:tetratricopeptide (TPR) repeat protein
MVFGAPAIKAAAAAAHEDEEETPGVSGSTMVFGGSPLAGVKVPPPKAPPAARAPPVVFAKPAPSATKTPAGAFAAKAEPALGGAADPGPAGSTMVFGVAPVKRAPNAAPAPLLAQKAPEPVAAPLVRPADRVASVPDPEPAPEPSAQPASQPAVAVAGRHPDPDQAEPSGDVETTADLDEPDSGGGDVSVSPDLADADAGGAAPGPEAPKGPPKSLLIGVFVLAAILVLALAGVMVMKKLSARPPSPESLQALAQAREAIDRDTLSSLAFALKATQQAIVDSPKSTFSEGRALQAEVEIAWADALADQGNLAEKASQDAADDAKRQELQSAAEKLRADSKTHLKSALEELKSAYKIDPKSPELALAYLSYFRAQGSAGEFGRWSKKAADAQADGAAIALQDALRLLGEDDGAEKALPKLDQAAKASPKSARLQYRLAQALELAKKEQPEVAKALQRTLDLSPQHERAKARLEAIVAAQKAAAAAAAAAGQGDAGSKK